MGVITTPVILGKFYGDEITIGEYTFYINDSNDSSVARLNTYGWILGGFLVGFGTRMGNGCTSGHAICGLPRLAARSVAACLSFVGAGMLMATFRYRHPFLNDGHSLSSGFYDTWKYVTGIAYIVAFVVVIIIVIF